MVNLQLTPKKTVLFLILSIISLIVAFSLLMVVPVSAMQVFVAQGDTANVAVSESGGTCWVFPESGIADPNLFDVSAAQYWGQDYCTIPKEYTANLDEGRYNVIYEIPALINNKSFIDVSYKNGLLVSALAQSDPYDTRGMDSQTIMQNFKNMVNYNGLNTLIVNEVVIEKPMLTVTSFGPASTKYYTLVKNRDSRGVIVPELIESPFYKISGETNLPNGSTLTIKIDEIRYYAQHSSKYTYTTEVVRSDFMPSNEWSCDIGVNMNDLPPGWHEISVYGGELLTTRQFKVDQQIKPQPTPTQYVNYLSNGDIAPVIINNTITVVKKEYVDRWQTATPTPVMTDALGSSVNYPYESGTTIPPEAGIACIVIIAVIILLKDGKRK